MMVAMKSKDSGKGKEKEKGKKKTHCLNPNCNKNSHTIKNCFTKGGGKKEALKWFKKLTTKQRASASAHIAKEGQDNEENYAMLIYDKLEDPTALIVTSNFKAEAHTISTDHGIILDTGTSQHFSLELTSKEFNEHLRNAGTVWHLTVHNSPASNGIVEWANWTHMNSACAMMIVASLPRNLWCEAVHHNVWLHNHAPTQGLAEAKTPMKLEPGGNQTCHSFVNGAQLFG